MSNRKKLHFRYRAAKIDLWNLKKTSISILRWFLWYSKMILPMLKRNSSSKYNPGITFQSLPDPESRRLWMVGICKENFNDHPHCFFCCVSLDSTGWMNACNESDSWQSRCMGLWLDHQWCTEFHFKSLFTKFEVGFRDRLLLYELVGPFQVEWMTLTEINSQAYCHFLEHTLFKQWYRTKSALFKNKLHTYIQVLQCVAKQ